MDWEGAAVLGRNFWLVSFDSFWRGQNFGTWLVFLQRRMKNVWVHCFCVLHGSSWWWSLPTDISSESIPSFFSAITWYQKPSTMSLAPTYFVVKMLMYTQNGLSHFLTGIKEKIKSVCVLSEKGEWMHAQRLLQVQFVPIELVHTKVLSHWTVYTEMTSHWNLFKLMSCLFLTKIVANIVWFARWFVLLYFCHLCWIPGFESMGRFDAWYSTLCS